MSFSDSLRALEWAALFIAGQLIGDVLYGGLSFIADQQQMEAAAENDSGCRGGKLLGPEPGSRRLRHWQFRKLLPNYPAGPVVAVLWS